MPLSDTFDLHLAWRKTKRNLADNQKVFINDPYIIDIIDRNKDEYLRNLSQLIDNGYSPSEARIVNTPKVNWNIRPASVLKIQDLTLYSAIVIDMYSNIREEIEWSARDQRYSRILRDDIDNAKWMVNSYTTWREYVEETQRLLTEYDYVVTTDINSYFENIGHRILDSKLKRVYNNQDSRELLWDCLERWHRPKTRGLPQGYYPSNILSELYFDSIDRHLNQRDVHYVRYSDDLNMFCEDKEEAIMALRTLIELYRDKGLYLNRKKTDILSSEDAHEEFKDPRDRIKPIQRKISSRIEKERKRKRRDIKRQDKDSKDVDYISEIETELPYTDGGEIKYSDMSNDEKVNVVERSFNRYIMNGDSLNGSLFRFLIKRMGLLNSYYAVPYCIEQIKEGGPDIRRIVDKYFSNLENNVEIANKLMDGILNGEIHYEFQKFVIIRWVFQAGIKNDSILSGMRSLIGEKHKIPETRNYIIAYLGKYGEPTDIETISNIYSNSTNEVRKAIILMAIRDMERSLRGTIYRQALSDHDYCDFSVRLAKEIT
ncbi:reverse transcriptase domain-containing protein [Halomontanus rarus]|uniref:reverse transcriptase domain-containing protein n=1 Tax=Halomontanus rarus TaxID=3034020 RepID=UPI00293B8FB9|nr:reverse transcriptase domain-containing protein [Halovivax sp. KZCA124]